MDSDNDSYHSENEFYYPDEISYFLNVKRTRTSGLKMAAGKIQKQKLLTKYSTEENNKHVISLGQSVLPGKNCALQPRPLSIRRYSARFRRIIVNYWMRFL